MGFDEKDMRIIASIRRINGMTMPKKPKQEDSHYEKKCIRAADGRCITCGSIATCEDGSCLACFFEKKKSATSKTKDLQEAEVCAHGYIEGQEAKCPHCNKSEELVNWKCDRCGWVNKEEASKHTTSCNEPMPKSGWACTNKHCQGQRKFVEPVNSEGPATEEEDQLIDDLWYDGNQVKEYGANSKENMKSSLKLLRAHVQKEVERAFLLRKKTSEKK